ncbi:hypothetical protein Sjap_025060 [Stephania japonica]|uniref:Uncharacterized protein n=1 Tax=Stephania japonica TaxID=461633 RepID=A0AAP0E0Y1_9MAGN
MQSPQKQGNSVLFQPIQEPKFYYYNYPSLNHHSVCTDQQSSGLDSSSVYNSPSTTLSFSTNGSKTIQESHSCPLSAPTPTDQPLSITDNFDFLDNLDIFQGQNQEDPSENQRWKHVMEVISRRELKEMMITCAESIANNNLFIADLLIAELKTMVSVAGEPIQRLSAYLLEGLIARLDLTDRANGGPPPLLRITGVDDAQSAYARNGGMEIVGSRLAKIAKSCKIPFEFHSAAMSGCEVDLNKLGLGRRPSPSPREAIAVNFPYVLHHMPDESVGTANHRDRLIRLVRSLNPKIVTLIEQESNTNTSSFVHRFKEALEFYTAMFESVEAAMPERGSRERINVEQNCLARDVVSIVGCEGEERVERHEVLGKWRARFGMAGFKGCPLSGGVKGCVESLLEGYSREYRVEEVDGALFLGWKGRRLFTCSAWQC